MRRSQFVGVLVLQIEDHIVLFAEALVKALGGLHVTLFIEIQPHLVLDISWRGSLGGHLLMDVYEMNAIR